MTLGLSSLLSWRRAIFPGAFASSILAAAGLNVRVRNGNGWFPRAKATRKRPPRPAKGQGNSIPRKGKLNSPGGDIVKVSALQ